MDSINQTREILKKDLKWLELDIDIPVSDWKTEISSAENYYQEYRDTESKGWSSCCLHGLAADKIYTADNYGLNEYDAPYNYTELSKHCPLITNFWKNVFPAERYTRIRFMKLESRGFIDWHDDGTIPPGFDPLMSILPINVAITHPEHCNMMVEDQTVPWKEGKLFLINISKKHKVVNNSNFTRVHMIANVILGNRVNDFCELLVRSYNKQHG
jgi:hypothetical protein